MAPSNEPAIDFHLPVDVPTVVLDAAGEVVEGDLLATVCWSKSLVLRFLAAGQSDAAGLAVAAIIVCDSSVFAGVAGWNPCCVVEDGTKVLVRALVWSPFFELGAEADHGTTSGDEVEQARFSDEVGWADGGDQLVSDLDVSSCPLRILFVWVALRCTDYLREVGLYHLTKLVVSSLLFYCLLANSWWSRSTAPIG